MKKEKIKVGVLGATGRVGQKLVALLENHPWFDLRVVAASENSAGKPYGSVVEWQEKTALPKQAAALMVQKCDAALDAKILFSALDANVAGVIEEEYAARGHIVISNARNHRLRSDVPLLVPEINASHLDLIGAQKSKSSANGFIITNPNCTTAILALALSPIQQKFGLEKILVTSMQALSGAGFPGVPASAIDNNVIPHIAGEEEKVRAETIKIFGDLAGDKIASAEIKISASCNRVNVPNGHTLSVSFATVKKASASEIIAALENFAGLDLPTSPKKPIQYLADPKRPQPLLDIDSCGMQVVCGNLRACEVLDWKMTVLGDNLVRGAAGAAILNAELVVRLVSEK